MDINTLRMAAAGMDCTYKTMVWNLSQNVDRDTMGKVSVSCGYLVRSAVQNSLYEHVCSLAYASVSLLPEYLMLRTEGVR